ncbi:PTS sugar transporter subunit IIB [Listeria monocytogenes]|uniref:PTS sugar transporter subunit IIB n=1 Tax=Listeria monocytogenes TaxID=1639 RepID=UPI002863646B|nr:PTS sugar transporter subunit IIB [Listeria monocytogenes]MDV2939606.1 PTS sugar transporter subunit IIB [Listeria monocytogenes]HDV6584387.1 PTS sugar transporter subunit IIB [Listeria monocytogenes]
MEILTVCGMGFGTSLMLLMEIQDMVKKHGFTVGGEATDLSSAKGRKCDMIVASSEIAKELAEEEVKVVPIINILDKKEIEEKVLPAIKQYFAS